MKTTPTILATVIATALLLIAPISQTHAGSPFQAQLQLNDALASVATTAMQSTPPQASTPFEARVEGYLRQSGYEFRKVRTNSWYILTTGKQLTQIRVLVGAGPSSLAVGAVVVSKQNLRVTSDLMQRMMKLSYDLNYVRICVDPDGDLIVMSQLRDEWLDADEFRRTVGLVAAAADRTFGEARMFLSAP